MTAQYFNETYELGKNRLQVDADGVFQYSPSNYIESSNNSITFLEPLQEGMRVIIEIIK